MSKENKWSSSRPYWGDLHCHCGISYGHGTLEYALTTAREHLDFCSITGHAGWPDIPADRERYGRVIDYHAAGFARLGSAWPKIVEEVSGYNREGSFATFSSYEWHSLQYGDYNLYFPGDCAPLVEASNIEELHSICDRYGALAIPHHPGYPQGLRGVSWDAFSESRSPLVEVFSMHGCAESDNAPYPYLHHMGPRTTSSTAIAGLNANHKFGFIASTDSHAGFPGHHGGGRIAAYARDLTREDLWEAFRSRRVYAVTGDRIVLKSWINDAFMGEVLNDSSTCRCVEVKVTSSDRIDHVDIVKNGRLLARRNGTECKPPDSSSTGLVQAKFRIEWGWGEKHEPTHWEASLRLGDGRILDVEPCFRGLSLLSPKGQEYLEKDLPRHKITSRESREVTWRSVTLGNPSFLHPSTCALVVEVEAPIDAPVRLLVNGKALCTSLRKLFGSSVASPLRGWLSESVCIHRAVASDEYHLHWIAEDVPESDTDYYYVRVAQENYDWAWSSPTWITR